MSPRAYRLGARQATTEQTRQRIIDAARRLLGDPHGGASFTVEAVARQANVARMTVYYQFGSKPGLLEAVYDDLAARGLVQTLPAVFAAPDTPTAILALVRVFFGFWNSDRLVMRRARALAALDVELEQGIRERDERRRQICRVVLSRSAGPPVLAPDREFDNAVAMLFTLSSFETFDALATDSRDFDDIVAMVQRLALHVAGFRDA
jgi:AcrR family transcriptional regulator